jgi:hypothetical protein
MVLDALKARWKDPDAYRYGRRGQGQHGVDILGKPSSLGGKLVAAQCKNTDTPSLQMLRGEITKTKAFPGNLAKYFFVVSAARDAELQDAVRALSTERERSGFFPLEVLFYEDVCQDLSADPALVAKHFPAWETTGRRTRTAPRPSLHYITEPDPSFVGREGALRTITAWYQGGRVRVTALLGLGGAGKSSIARRWYDRIRTTVARRRKIFWWGFYRNASLDECLDSLLDYIADKPLSAEAPSRTIDKISMIGARLHDSECLCIFDGFEAVQMATPTGCPGTGRPAHDCTAEILKSFTESTGRVFLLVTTRYPLDPLRGYEGGSYKPLDVPGFGLKDAITLFKRFHISAKRHEVESVWHLFEGHALSLRLLTTFLQEYYDGNIHAIQEIPPLTSPEIDEYGLNEREGGKARRILLWYDRNLTEAQRVFMKILSIFAKPVTRRDLSSVFRTKDDRLKNEDLATLSTIAFANLIKKLTSLRLVTTRTESGQAVYEAHPLIKEYFSSLVAQEAVQWHRALTEYYESSAHEDQDEDERILRDKQIVHHALRSKQYQSATDASKRLLGYARGPTAQHGTIDVIRPYHTSFAPFAGSSYREVLKKACQEYDRLRGGPGWGVRIRSAYFDNEEVDFDYFWDRLSKKSFGERVARVRLLPCAIEVIRNSRADPLSLKNPNATGEVIHRFAGMTKSKDLFFVHLKEDTSTGRKFFMSAFSPTRPPSLPMLAHGTLPAAQPVPRLPC